MARTVCRGTSYYDDEKELICINNGDVIILEYPYDPRFAFNAETLLIDKDNGDYMKDIQTSKIPKSYRERDKNWHILFLTSAGNVFTYGKNDKGQFGVDNIEEIDEIDDELDGFLPDNDIIEIPCRLNKGILLNKFITNIWVGRDFSLCLDRDKSLMSLDTTKYKENIIWHPVPHNLFNNGENGKIIMDITCGSRFICFIDDKYQCYWRSEQDDGLVHFQSLYDDKHKLMLIQNVLVHDQVNEKAPILTLLDTNKQLMYFDIMGKDINNRLRIFKMDNIVSKNDKIMHVAWKGGSYVNDVHFWWIFVKNKMNFGVVDE